MKKFAISLLALAAVSTVALASPHDGTTTNHDNVAPFGVQKTQRAATVTTTDALAVSTEYNGTLTPFERLNKNAEENDHGSRR